MEIRLRNGYYCLNPRRIIYVKYYLAHEHEDGYQLSPNISKKELERIADEGFISPDFVHCIDIKMTDGENIKFRTEDLDYYNNIKAKLENIVGG